uniref:ADAM metallopeptidase domain 28 n=1 Tax=Periophthalmus magnuspinnatus TaxID=409849 RepID=A0A3B4AS04_9GOBI
FLCLQGGSILDMQKYMEFYIVADNKEVYKPLLTFVALVGLEIWTDADKITLSSNTEQNLDNFMNWRNKNLINKKHDCAHLISGIDFAGDTIGLAFVGALCTGFSVGVVQDYTDTSALVGATLAHELGHNLGMSHDTTTCKCSADSCIMEATVKTWSAPKDFSTCSRSKYEEFLLSRGVDCLLDKPDYKTLVSPPVCGNGFVEAGEQCDCGTVKECTNCCCNASTCILGRSRECRRKRDECDLAEYCDGASAVCPEDVFSVNGLPCDNTKGFCYNGECPQRSRQCNKMYGPGEGALTLLDIQGLASKKKHMLIQYFTMTDQSGTLTSSCFILKVCIQNQCVDLETAYKTAACSAKCPGRSVSAFKYTINLIFYL